MCSFAAFVSCHMSDAKRKLFVLMSFHHLDKTSSRLKQTCIERRAKNVKAFFSLTWFLPWRKYLKISSVLNLLPTLYARHWTRVLKLHGYMLCNMCLKHLAVNLYTNWLNRIGSFRLNFLSELKKVFLREKFLQARTDVNENIDVILW